MITGNLGAIRHLISRRLAYATSVTPGDFGSCPNQYWNGGPLPSLDAQLFGEWTGVGLDPNSLWSDTSTTQTLNTSAINLRYAGMLGTTTPTARFVIDTSRNARGPLANGAHYAAAPYDQPSGNVTASLTSGNWCNPPGDWSRPATDGEHRRGARGRVPLGEDPGRASTARATSARAAPGRGITRSMIPWSLTGDAQNHFDPLWGWSIRRQATGSLQQALQLAQNATPPLPELGVVSKPRSRPWGAAWALLCAEGGPRSSAPRVRSGQFGREPAYAAYHVSPIQS